MIMNTRCAVAKTLLSGLGTLILAGAAIVLAPRLAEATTLTGDSIQVYRLVPDTTTIYDTLGPITDPDTASGGGEHVLVSANQISFTPYFGSSSFGAATFNGFEILDLTKDPHIIGVSVNAASTAPLASISDFFFTSKAVFINFQGRTVVGTAIYDLTFATPLPAALPLFASSLGALALFGWRRKQAQSSGPA
jgi:hypothetical protein